MSKLSIAGFTNIGYRFHARSHQPIDADLSGKTAVVTGATGGLGLEAARDLAGLGARVAIVGRSADKLRQAEASIPGDVVAYQADLSLMSEVRSLAAEIRDGEERLDILINNVGVLLPERTHTGEGIETTLATNLAGHFILTNMLASRLIESAPARVINVTSGGMYSERIKPDDLQFESGRYIGTAAYARSKRGQVILTELWAKRFAGTGVVVHAMHPGWAKTSGVETSLPTFNRFMGPLLRSPEQGADTIVWLAASAEAGESTGNFWFDRSIAPTHLVERTMETHQERSDLWAALVKLTGSDMEVLSLSPA